MAVSKSKKNEILQNLIDELKEAKSVWFAQTTGMKVSDFSDLRNELRWVSTSYTLAKKTLVKIAVKEVYKIDLDLSIIPGQIWVVCSKEDAIAGLSKTNDFMKKVFDKNASTQKIDWAASIFEWELKEIEETKVIASMPSRETLLSRLVGSMMSPLSGMARFFDAASKELETQQKSKLWELKVEKVNKEEPKAEDKKEETKTEEVKEESKA